MREIRETEGESDPGAQPRADPFDVLRAFGTLQRWRADAGGYRPEKAGPGGAFVIMGRIMKSMTRGRFSAASKPRMLGLIFSLLAASAASGGTYHQVTVSATIYSPGGGANVTETVINDRWLIEQILNVSAKDARQYAVVLNDLTGQIEIYSIAGGFPENEAIEPTGVTADLANSAGTKAYETSTIEVFGTSSFSGSEVSLMKEDGHGDILSDSITFNAGYIGSGIILGGGYGIGSPAVIKGTISTTGKKYTN